MTEAMTAEQQDPGQNPEPNDITLNTTNGDADISDPAIFHPTSEAGLAAAAHLTETPENNFIARQLPREEAIAEATLGPASNVQAPWRESVRPGIDSSGHQQKMAGFKNDFITGEENVNSAMLEYENRIHPRGFKGQSEALLRADSLEIRLRTDQELAAEFYDRLASQHDTINPQEFREQFKEYINQKRDVEAKLTLAESYDGLPEKAYQVLATRDLFEAPGNIERYITVLHRDLVRQLPEATAKEYTQGMMRIFGTGSALRLAEVRTELEGYVSKLSEQLREEASLQEKMIDRIYGKKPTVEPPALAVAEDETLVPAEDAPVDPAM